MLGFIRLLAQSQRKQLALGRLSNFSSALSSSDSGKEITIHWVRKDGSIQVTKGSIGENIMRIAHQYGIELEGACEGVCACSTCHVILESTVYDKLPEPSENEEDMLDQAFGLKATSRLGCQVVVTAELDGMRVQLPAATRNFYVVNMTKSI
jgi:ferredoxin